jgi:hypothetical protein
VLQSAQQIASLPIPFKIVLGLTFPHPGHFFATNGSPTKLPSCGVSIPDAEALEVISIFLTDRLPRPICKSSKDDKYKVTGEFAFPSFRSCRAQEKF